MYCMTMNYHQPFRQKFSAHNDLRSVARTTHRCHGSARFHRVRFINKVPMGSTTLLVLKIGLSRRKSWASIYDSKKKAMTISSERHSDPDPAKFGQIFWLSSGSRDPIGALSSISSIGKDLICLWSRNWGSAFLECGYFRIAPLILPMNGIICMGLSFIGDRYG